MTLSSKASQQARRAIRLGAVVLATATLALTTTGPAAAHVRLISDDTTTGSFSALTFRVPNESSTTGTVKVSVQLPQDKPFLYVSSKPVPGWKATLTEAPLPKPVVNEGTTITKAVRTITWTADRQTQISAGEYQEFSISVGPLPAPGTLLLPAKQTYSDGKIVSWDQPTPASGAEPEHPAPLLEVSAAEPEKAQPANDSRSGDSGQAVSRTDLTARWLAGGALAVAVASVVLSTLGSRRPGTGAAGSESSSR
jgi:uncharacterized protein YcnI